jgi:Fe(3+) dicitrate transport protein
VTQGWRPLRFLDLASPFTDLQPRSTADASRSLSWEAGVHGTPLKGLFYDASLFWIEVRNRVETQALGPLDTVNVNTGDTRNRGFEGELVYDFLAGRPDRSHLEAFANLALLDARFTKSDLPGQVGRTPAFSPRTLAKAGLTWRRDRAFDASLTVVSVGSQFFQDSDQGTGAGASFVPARIPSYTVLDLSGDWWITSRLRFLGGVRNLNDARYYSQALQTGLTPAPGRTAYAGLALGF